MFKATIACYLNKASAYDYLNKKRISSTVLAIVLFLYYV